MRASVWRGCRKSGGISTGWRLRGSLCCAILVQAADNARGKTGLQMFKRVTAPHLHFAPSDRCGLRFRPAQVIIVRRNRANVASTIFRLGQDKLAQSALLVPLHRCYLRRLNSE
jgi:hypothetical protein